MKKNYHLRCCCLPVTIIMLVLLASAYPTASLANTSVSEPLILQDDMEKKGFFDGWELQWSYAYGGNGHAQFAQPVGDIDEDGVNEVLLGGYENFGVCRILSYDTIQNTYIEEFSWFVPGGSYHSPSGACVVDLDEDGDLEFCVSWAYSGADGVYAYDWDGTTLTTLDWYSSTGVDFVYDIYTCDYDDDGHPEVLIANDPNPGGIHVSALGWNNQTTSFSYETSWTCPSGSGYSVPMVWSGDVDNDGKTEVIADVSNLDYATAGTWALNWDDTTSTWIGVAVYTGYPAGTTVFGLGVGDVDGDGSPEIGVGSYGGPPGGWLFEWDGDEYILVWHGEYPGQDPVIESVAIGDADNDGEIEFCFGTGNVHVIGWDGSLYYEEATLTGPTNMLAGLIIGDCDSDGDNEVKGCEILGGTGSEFIWKYVLTDAIPPVTTCILDGELDGEVYRSDVTVILTATDNGSGVDVTRYRLDSGAWTEYLTPFLVTEDGIHTVLFYSVDKSGNVEEQQKCVFTIQHALPLDVSIKGRIGVSLVIKNNGTTSYTDISWSMALEGGFLVKENQSSGVILQLPPGCETTKKLPVLGFGTVTITVMVDGIQKTMKGFVLLFFVLGVR
ncbi:hypothetical protein AYK25_07840 [Thermoplasmatales archaeon SM1-50]|nr:MAG: hypothetical protein AYK25_07840 [Thermoplasmatales archaeon SM1-50]